MYVPPSGVSWLGLWPGATPRPTKRASVPAVLLKAVRGRSTSRGGYHRSRVGRSDIVPMPCAFTHDILDMIAMIAEVRTACWSSDQDAARRLETLPASLQPLCLKTSRVQAGWSGELYYAPPTCATDRLADLRVPSGRMELFTSSARSSSQVSGVELLNVRPRPKMLKSVGPGS